MGGCVYSKDGPRVRVTGRLKVRVRARVISSAACRWFSCGCLQVGVPCSSRGRVRARVCLVACRWVDCKSNTDWVKNEH
jgi:hypothetical protein